MNRRRLTGSSAPMCDERGAAAQRERGDSSHSIGRASWSACCPRRPVASCVNSAGAFAAVTIGLSPPPSRVVVIFCSGRRRLSALKRRETDWGKFDERGPTRNDEIARGSRAFTGWDDLASRDGPCGPGSVLRPMLADSRTIEDAATASAATRDAGMRRGARRGRATVIWSPRVRRCGLDDVKDLSRWRETKQRRAHRERGLRRRCSTTSSPARTGRSSGMLCRERWSRADQIVGDPPASTRSEIS